MENDTMNLILPLPKQNNTKHWVRVWADIQLNLLFIYWSYGAARSTSQMFVFFFKGKRERAKG